MTLIIIAIIVLIVIVPIGVIILANGDYKSKLDKISFKEAMDLAELPVVTFYQGDKKFNFLLDTGSNYSHICGEAAKAIESTRTTCDNLSVSGIGGSDEISHSIIANLSYKGRKYEVELCVGEHLDKVFAEIKATTGVMVHGLMGNQFLQKYKYILDFDELIAYEKK